MHVYDMAILQCPRLPLHFLHRYIVYAHDIASYFVHAALQCHYNIVHAHDTNIMHEHGVANQATMV